MKFESSRLTVELERDRAEPGYTLTGFCQRSLIKFSENVNYLYTYFWHLSVSFQYLLQTWGRLIYDRGLRKNERRRPWYGNNCIENRRVSVNLIPTEYPSLFPFRSIQPPQRPSIPRHSPVCSPLCIYFLHLRRCSSIMRQVNSTVVESSVDFPGAFGNLVIFAVVDHRVMENLIKVLEQGGKRRITISL